MRRSNNLASPSAKHARDRCPAHRIWPVGLTGRVCIVVLAAICAVFLASSFIYRQAQISQVSVIRLSVLAEELSADLDMLRAVSPHIRAAIVARLSNPNLRLSIRDHRVGEDMVDGQCLAPGINAVGSAHTMLSNAHLCVADVGSETVGIRGALSIDGKQDLVFEMPHVLVVTSMNGAVAIAAITAVAVCGVSAILIRALSLPLRTLSSVANHLGNEDEDARTVVSEGGPREVRGLAHAINALQTRIQKLIEDKTSVLAAVSHDLRTPLARLRLRADFLEDEEARCAIVMDIDEMEAMINGVLAFLAGNNDPEVPRVVDLVAIISTLLDSQADQGRATTYAGPDRCLLTLRPIAIKRVFANLIHNACIYGGSAEVSLTVEESKVVISVSDHGPGVPEHDLARITEAFYRVDHSRSRQTGGAGLGLAIVKREVKRAHGRLSFRNIQPSGLEVQVTLPKMS